MSKINKRNIFAIMKMTLHKYIFNEIWPAFLVSLFVLVFIMLTTSMLSITELVVAQGVGLWYILKLIFYLLPSLVLFALPAASLISVLVAFLRLSSDNEIIALQSSGISHYQILPPVFVLSFLAYLIATCFAIYISPWGNRSFKDSIFMIAKSKADLGIKERIFCEPFDALTFYINSFSPKENIMKDVFIVDSRDPSITNTIVAREGKIFSQPKSRTLTIGLFDGTVFMVDK
ncbi:MAG: LptF/LptG family permease, partial [Nitrospinota bacterium]